MGGPPPPVMHGHTKPQHPWPVPWGGRREVTQAGWEETCLLWGLVLLFLLGTSLPL